MSVARDVVIRPKVAQHVFNISFLRRLRFRRVLLENVGLDKKMIDPSGLVIQEAPGINKYWLTFCVLDMYFEVSEMLVAL